MKPWMILLAAAPIPGIPGSRAPARPTAPPRTPPPSLTSIALVVKSGAKEVRTTSKPRQSTVSPRLLAEAGSGETPQVRWMIRNEDKKAPLRSVVVHFLIHKIGAADEAIPTAPQKGSFADQVLGTDLKAAGVTTGSFNTPIYKPGVYLIELELLDPQGARLQFAAIDLNVVER